MKTAEFRFTRALARGNATKRLGNNPNSFLSAVAGRPENDNAERRGDAPRNPRHDGSGCLRHRPARRRALTVTRRPANGSTRTFLQSSNGHDPQNREQAVVPEANDPAGPHTA